MSKILKFSGLMGIILATGMGSAFAATPQKVGTTVGSLVCNTEGTIGKIITSSQELTCEFKSNSKNGINENYKATITKFGLDLGISGKGQMTWLVMAASNNAFEPGALAGSYSGISAGASVGVGGNLNLLGSASNNFTLQPLSAEAKLGLNLAVGVSKMTLVAEKPAATVSAKKHTKTKQHAKKTNKQHVKKSTKHTQKKVTSQHK